MRIFVYILFVVLSSCNSVAQTKQNDYKGLFVSNETLLNNAVSFIKENFAPLYSSNCTLRKGTVIISQKSVENGCYPSLKASVKSVLDTELYYSIEAYKEDEILFVLDFLPNDSKQTETTYYYLYCKNGTLPNIYESWKGMKSKLNENWWYIERIESQF